jgi:DNA-binding winged helix-turn-helix (wHTH) protein/tetratricopeptide (TPR) repeat protein
MSPEPVRTVRPAVVRFEGFELDLQSGLLSRNGTKNRLQGQPLQLLELLLLQPGQIVTREQIQQCLWPDGTVVEFEHSVNAAVKRLRAALEDDAEKPTFIETIPRRGYCFIARVENGPLLASASVEEHVEPVLHNRPLSEVGKKLRLVIAASVAALLFAAALAAWRVFFARPVLTGADVILLASFVNRTGDPIFDNSLDKALEVKLTESPFLSLFPEADVQRTMGMMRHDPNERVTQELAIEICRRQGLKALVVPEIDAFGGRYLITLEAIDARTQKSIARRQEEAGSKDKVIAALGKAASQLRRQLGESLNSLEKFNAPLDLATTSSLEALQAYRAGLIPFRSGKTREAIPFFERAVELDPQFCSAYGMLGHAFFSIGDEQNSRKSFARAFELKDRRLTSEENYQITASYHAYITGNLDKEAAILVLYQQAYPRSISAANRLGINYAMLGRPDEALQRFKWAIDHSPEPSAHLYSNASQTLMSLDRLDESKNLLDQWRQKGSLAPFQREMRYRIAIFDNDAATMEQLAHETPADDIPWLELQMQLAFLRGDLGKFRSLSEILVKQNIRATEMENAANELALHAQLESFLGNYALARRLAHQAVEGGKDSASELWRSAEAFGYAGDITQAETLAAKLDRMFPEDTLQQKVYLQLIRSIIERERGNALKAADLLAPAVQYQTTLDVPYQRAQAYLAAGEPALAAADFKQLLGHRGWGWWQVYAPLAQLGIARAYAMQGDWENSRKAYNDFFSTWKNADSDIPILRQAKAEYKKLTSTASAASSASTKKQ